MQLNKRFWLILLMILVLSLAACDSDGDATEAVTTDTTEEATLELSETITTLDGITLSYPAGWIASEETGGLTLANDESVMTSPTFEAGQIGATVVLLPDTTTDDAGVETILQSFIDSTLGEDSSAQMTFSEIETFDANGNAAALVVGTGSDTEVSNALASVIVDVGDNLVLFSYIAAEGELDQFVDTIRAIASTVSYDSAGAEAEG